MENKKIKRLIRANTIYIFLILLFLAACILSPDFRQISNISNLFSQSSIIGILAVGQTVVLLTGGLDLSHGSFLALVSILIAITVPYGVPVAFLAVLAGLLCLGLVNAFFVNKGIFPFIVTLGMQGVARTLALWLADENSVAIPWAGIRRIAYGTVFGIPASVLMWVVFSLGFACFLNRTRLGRHIHAVGGNSESARLSGISVGGIRYLAYGISAFCAFAAGVIYVSRLGVGLPDKAVGYEMDSIACSIIGGTSLFGGVGRLSGTFAGVLIYGIITNILNLKGVSSYWQSVVKGLIVLLAVYFNTRAGRREVK